MTNHGFRVGEGTTGPAGRWITWFIGTIFLLGYAASAAAAMPNPPDYTQFFTVPGTDISAQLLVLVFGPSFASLTGFAGTSPVPPTAINNAMADGGLIGVVSQSLDVACGVLTILIITWGGITAAISMASDGPDMVRRYHHFWVPMRSVLSFGMLAPVSGGYSLVQTILFQLIYISIGLANAAFVNCLDYFAAGQPAVPAVTTNALSEIVANGMRMAACEAYFGSSVSEDVQSTPVTPIFSWTNNSVTQALNLTSVANTKSYEEYSLTVNGTSGSPVAEDAGCGRLMIHREFLNDSTTMSFAEQAYSNELQADQTLYTQLKALAQQIVAAEQPGAGPADNAAMMDSFRSQLQQIQQAYINDVFGSATSFASSAINTSFGSNTTASQFNQEISAYGWALAGFYYWNLDSLNREIQQLTMPQTHVSGPDDSFIAKSTSPDAVDYANIVTVVNAILANPGVYMTGSDAPGAITSAADFAGQDASMGSLNSWGWMTILCNHFFNAPSLDRFFVSRVTQDGDFVANLRSIGDPLFEAGTTILTVATIATAGAETVNTVQDNAGPLGTVTKFTPQGASLAVLSHLIAKVGKGLIMASLGMIFIGAVLAFYLPMIPLYIWLTTVINWMISSIKIIFAADVWAAAHAIPEGEGWAGTNARQGYMLLIAAVLRPILSVGGLFAGMVMIQVVGYFFRIVLPLMGSQVAGGVPGLYASVVLIFLFAGMMVMVAHRIFGMTYEVGEEILKFIGGGIDSLGDSGHNERMRAFIGGQIPGGVRNVGGQVLGGGGGRPPRNLGGGSGGAGGGGGGRGEAPSPSEQGEHVQEA